MQSERRKKNYFNVDGTMDGFAGYFSRYDIFGLPVSEHDVLVYFRQDYRIVRRVDRRVWCTQEPSREFSLLNSWESGIVPYSCDLIILDSRVDDPHAQLLETDAAPAVLREVAVRHGIYRVRRIYVRIQNSQAILQIVKDFDTVQWMPGEIDL